MFIKERLPPKDKELQVYTNDRNLVTRTQNRQVQLLNKNNGIRKRIDVNSPKTIDDNMANAVQKKKSRLPMGTQKVVGTKRYHTVQLATENKAVKKGFPITKWKMTVRNPKDRIFDHRLRTVNR